MFNSQRVNQDPYPYVCDDSRSSHNSFCDRCEYKPRPEYGNDPNEILIAFRAAGGDKNHRGGVGGMASRVLRNEIVWDLKYSEPAMKEHARKVLTRLVNVYGEVE